jgi:uncharacterized membrane protein
LVAAKNAERRGRFGEGLIRLVPGWHPVIVHFPLALVVTAACCFSVSRVPRASRIAETLAIVGTWTLGVGALGLLFALGTGLAAVIDLHVGDAARLAISSHVKSAILTAVLVLSAAVWRGAGVAQQARPSWGFMLVMWLATSSLIVTGYRGGQNVYRYGVGVSMDAAAAHPSDAAHPSKRSPP